MTTTLTCRSEPSHATASGAARPTSVPRRPVRVCFLIDELTTAGTETQLLALIERIDRRRVQPFLCLLRGQDECSRVLEPDDCSVFRLDVGSLRHPATLTKAWQFVRFLRRERIDVVQVYFPESTYVGVPAAWWAGVPRIVRTRNNLGYWMTPWHRFLGRLCNRFTDVLVANCDAARQSVLADGGLSGEQVVVLENGVDLARFSISENAARRELRRVGVVANLRPIKGLDNFVRAASVLMNFHPDVTFHIAGEGPLWPELERLAVGLGLKERFVLEGPVTDVPSFLADLDVAVLPSRSEGMSNALLEYMAAGKAIVATAVGGNARLIDDGVHGLLVPPDNSDALATAIGRLLSERELANRLGRAARLRVEEKYSREAMVKRFEDFYLWLMSHSRNLAGSCSLEIDADEKLFA
jgi:glycosyltransferase involved in cell wall biosynthesis